LLRWAAALWLVAGAAASETITVRRFDGSLTRINLSNINGKPATILMCQSIVLAIGLFRSARANYCTPVRHYIHALSKVRLSVSARRQAQRPVCKGIPCPSSKMRLTTKVRVSNGSGGPVSGDLQIEICGMQRCVTSLLRPSRGSHYALLTQFIPLLKR